MTLEELNKLLPPLDEDINALVVEMMSDKVDDPEAGKHMFAMFVGLHLQNQRDILFLLRHMEERDMLRTQNGR
jgi:hypothetical protein